MPGTADPLEQMLGIPTPSYTMGPSPAGLVGPGAEAVPAFVDGPMPPAAPSGAAPGLPALGSGSGGGQIGSSSPGLAAPTGGSGVRPPEPLPDGDTAQLDAEFWQRHGRAPTELEVEAYLAVPLLQRNLGRPPMKIELLQHLNSRLENPRPAPSSRVIGEQESVDGLPADALI